MSHLARVDVSDIEDWLPSSMEAQEMRRVLVYGRKVWCVMGNLDIARDDVVKSTLTH
jgi:hypothetical protein